MKTHDVLSLSEGDLTQKLKLMKIKELERHAQKILKKCGQPAYAKVLAAVIKAVPGLNNSATNKFADVQAIIRSHISLSRLEACDEGLIQRLTVIIMMIITIKFKAIHTSS